VHQAIPDKTCSITARSVAVGQMPHVQDISEPGPLEYGLIAVVRMLGLIGATSNGRATWRIELAWIARLLW
jgi:hypothetical protein